MSTSIEDLTARAKTLIAERKYQEAVRACRRVLLSRPEMVSVRLLLGMALLALRRHEEARAEMMAVLRRSPDEAAAHRLLGEAQLRAGQPDRAKPSLERALELDPGDEEAQELLREVDEEDGPPPSATIDRWFDPEAVATIQTANPAFEEEKTGEVSLLEVDSQSHPVPEGAFGDVPSVEVDPSLFAQAGRLAVGEGPEESTIEDRDPDVVSSFTPPVRRRPPPQRRGPSSFPPPPPDSVRPSAGSAGPPRRSDLPPPSAPRPPPRRGPSSFPPPPGVPGGYASTTSASTPAAKSHDPQTHELSVRDIDEVESVSISQDGPPPRRGAPLPPQFDDEFPPFEAQPTFMRRPKPAVQQQPAPQAFPPRSDDPLDEERTKHRGTPAARFPGDDLPGPGGFGDPVMTVQRGAPRPPEEPQQPEKKPPKRGPGLGRKRPPVGLLIVLLVLPIVVVIGGWLIVTSYVESEAEDAIVAAAAAAGDDGLKASLEEAIALIAAYDGSDEGIASLHARLLATLTYEHGDESAEEATALLDRLGPDATADAHIARAYLALAAGDVTAAEEALGTAPGDDPELSRARALVGAASRDLGRAEVAASAAVAARPEAPRHVALLALVRAENGDVTAAKEALDGVPNGNESAWVRVTRARVLFDSGGDPAAAVSEADAVLSELADRATPSQRGWAHLARGRQLLGARDVERALGDARRAAQTRPPGDERYALLLAETLLGAGVADEAGEVLGSMPVSSREAARRAALRAEIALEAGDIDEAARALIDVGDDTSPHASYLRGRVAEARGDEDEAREQYEAAAASPNELVRANARLGAMELEAGNGERAVELLSAAAERQPADLEVVPLLVAAHLSRDEVDEAAAIVEAALSRREGAVELLYAKAQVMLAKGEADDALVTLRGVAEQRPTSAEIRVTLGEAARRVGENDEARQAFERTLELDGEAVRIRAFVGLAGLAADAGELDRARRTLTRAEEAEVDGPGLTRVRAELRVYEGAGQAAVSDLSALASANEDAGLYVALGRAYWQAERDNEARRAFTRALAIDGRDPEAHLGLAFVRIRNNSHTGARTSIREARAAGERRGATRSFEARVFAARSRLAFERGLFEEAKGRAREAIERDSRCSQAHLVLAMVAEEEGRDVAAHLRRAAEGTAPPPEVLGRLVAATSGSGDDRCDLARRYMEAAPQGYDAPDVRPVLQACGR